MTYKCNQCGKILSEDERLLIGEDPSPSGISLPAGEYVSAYCPQCMSDDIDEFNLAEALELTEGDDDRSAILEFNGTKLFCYVDDDGSFKWTSVA